MMRRDVVRIATLVLCVGAVASVARVSRAQNQGAKACFEQLKSLSGDWVSQSPDGKEITSLRFRVTAGGSAVEEIEFPGTSHEMITLFHLDGDQLVLTHYCHLGNQPHMRATAASTPDLISFECTGSGGSLKSHDEMHMHAARYTFPEKDRIDAVWTLSNKGKPGGLARFAARRKEKA
jgi:hypothetical protein